MSELAVKDKSELEKLLAEKRESLRNFYFGVTGSKTRNIREGRKLRRGIAAILTELSLRK